MIMGNIVRTARSGSACRPDLAPFLVVRGALAYVARPVCSLPPLRHGRPQCSVDLVRESCHFTRTKLRGSFA